MIIAGHAHLDAHIAEVIRHALAGVQIDALHQDAALALGQQLVTDPVLARKVAEASLVGVVFAQHACAGVAPVVPARACARCEQSGDAYHLTCTWVAPGLHLTSPTTCAPCRAAERRQKARQTPPKAPPGGSAGSRPRARMLRATSFARRARAAPAVVHEAQLKPLVLLHAVRRRRRERRQCHLALCRPARLAQDLPHRRLHHQRGRGGRQQLRQPDAKLAEEELGGVHRAPRRGAFSAWGGNAGRQAAAFIRQRPAWPLIEAYECPRCQVRPGTLQTVCAGKERFLALLWLGRVLGLATGGWPQAGALTSTLR
jgi:hypothetical protein